MMKSNMTPFINKDVQSVFEAYPEKAREYFLFIRELLFTVAAETSGVGPIDECLRWGEPSYITSKTKSGSLVRIHHKKNDEYVGVYFHCQTTLIEGFRHRYSDVFTFQGNRALMFNMTDEVPVNALKDCLRQALTYRLSKTENQQAP